MSIQEEPIRHFERPGKRVLDLRKLGVPFVPVLSVSNPPKAMPGPTSLHVHRGCVEIVYCVRGANFCFETPERDYPFLPRTVFVSREDEPHRLSFNPNGHFVYRVLVALPRDGGRFAGATAAESAWLRNALFALPRAFRVRDESVRLAFERLFACYDEPVPTARQSVLLRTAAYDLLFAVLAASERTAEDRRDPVVVRWMKRIEDHPEADFDFAAMSANAKLPPGVFASRFAAVAGLPPRTFRNACRVRKAQRLLEQGASVTETAFALRFCSSQHFTKIFKRETGRSPSEWRK